MTKDELKKEATEYALEWGEKTDGTYACCKDGYLAGAEPREKRIAELEKENTEAKEIIEELIRFQPYIDREAMFHSIGNEWKIAIYEAERFLKEIKND